MRIIIQLVALCASFIDLIIVVTNEILCPDKTICSSLNHPTYIGQWNYSTEVGYIVSVMLLIISVSDSMLTLAQPGLNTHMMQT